MAISKLKAIKTNLNQRLNYIMQPSKTENIYIGSLNCRSDKAYSEMQKLKSNLEKLMAGLDII